MYHCRAQNKLGSQEGTVSIVHQYEPNCIVGLCEGFVGGAAAATVSSACSALVMLLLATVMMRH